MLDYIPNWLVSYFRGYLFYWTETICLSTRQKSIEQHVTSVSLGCLINNINIAQLHLSFEKINFPSATLVTERYAHECMLSRFSRVWLFVTPRTVVCQVPLSVGFSRQEHWSGLLSPPPGDLPDPGIEPSCLMFLAFVGRFFTTSAT